MKTRLDFKCQECKIVLGYIIGDEFFPNRKNLPACEIDWRYALEDEIDYCKGKHDNEGFICDNCTKEMKKRLK
jgi:hypothetical protein